MSKLLDISKRQAKLIELMSEREEYLPAKYYADCLKVSERTIFNDITKLEGLLTTYHIVIDKKPNLGIKLCGEIISLDHLIQDVFKKTKIKDSTYYTPLDRQILIVKSLLIENKTVTYQSLSLDFYISTTSIIKDVHRIRTFMDDDVKLVSDVKGTRVYGTETGIQRALKRFAYYLIEQVMHNYSLSSYSKILDPLFGKDIVKVVYQSMQELISALDCNVSEQYLKSLFISLLVLTARSYRGNHLNDSPKIQIEGIEYLTNYPLAIQICHSISSHLCFTFSDLEHRYVSNQLFAHRIEAKVHNKYFESLFSSDIKSIISDASEALEIDLTTDDKLYDSLIYHMFPMIYRIKSDIDIVNPLLNEIKNNYGVLFRVICYILEDFEGKYGIKLTDDDIGFITIHFRVAIERKAQISKILVVCQTGLVTSDLILNRIQKLLPANLQFKLIAKPHLEDEDISSVDFIISSVQLDNIDMPIVYVSPLVSDADLMKIYSYYLKYSASSVKKKDTDKLEPDIILRNLNSRYVFLNEKVKTKQACLEKMIHLLEKDGIVQKNFKASVYEREELGNTSVQKWVAAPHGLQSYVNETKIAIMTTEEPIKWNNESDVSFIILLAVAERDIVHIRKLLGHIYRIILNTENIERSIKSLKQPNDLINLFSGKF